MDPLTAPPAFWDHLFSMGAGYGFMFLVLILYRKEIGALAMAILAAPRGDAQAAKMLGVMTEQFGTNLEHFQAVQSATERAAKATEEALPLLREIATELKIQTDRGARRR